jgi:hypothetical protein
MWQATSKKLVRNCYQPLRSRTYAVAVRLKTATRSAS